MAKNTMTALAAIPNPLVPDSDPNGQETLLFYLCDNLNFNLQRRRPGSSDPNDTPIIPPGPLCNPSSFAVLRYNNIVEAYGMVSGTDKDKNPIYQPYGISPAYRPLAASTDIPALAACGNGKDQGWVYFLKDKASPHMYQITLAGGPTPKKKDDPVPLATSYLAACYDQHTNQRYVFYQSHGEEKQWVRCWSVDGGGIVMVDNTNDVKRDNSPLAAAVIPAPSGKGNYIVLYYVRGDSSLQRVTFDGKKWTPSNTDEMSQAPPVDQSSQMTVVVDVKEKKLRVFYVEKDQQSKGFVMWSDDCVQRD